MRFDNKINNLQMEQSGTTPEEMISQDMRKRYQRLATDFNVEVDDIQNPPMDINDNTDDVEPSRAIISKKDGNGGGNNHSTITSKSVLNGVTSPKSNRNSKSLNKSSNYNGNQPLPQVKEVTLKQQRPIPKTDGHTTKMQHHHNPSQSKGYVSDQFNNDMDSIKQPSDYNGGEANEVYTKSGKLSSKKFF